MKCKLMTRRFSTLYYDVEGGAVPLWVELEQWYVVFEDIEYVRYGIKNVGVMIARRGLLS